MERVIGRSLMCRRQDTLNKTSLLILGHIPSQSGGQGQHRHKCHWFMWLVMQLWHIMWLNAEGPDQTDSHENLF